MSTSSLNIVSRLLEATVEGIDISTQQYEVALRRYEDLGLWLVSQGIGDPDVYPQGSFRLGTVVRPIAGGDFDIDLVFLRYLAKESINQSELRAQAGQLLTEYIAARAVGNGNPRLMEKARCWQLIYEGDRFHMDVLPVIPDPEGDQTSVLLSDRDRFLWQHSNPIGYAEWFWASMHETVEVARANLAASLQRAAEDVPQWLVRTTLQRVVQLLKLHRDAFFKDIPNDKPASILITTLATHAYGGEHDVFEAFRKVTGNLQAQVERRAGVWWVPNPAHSEENFADKWNTNPGRKSYFDRWIASLIAETNRWSTCTGIDDAVKMIGARLGNDSVRAGAKRVGTGLASASSTGGLSVSCAGLVNQSSGAKIRPHNFHA